MDVQAIIFDKDGTLMKFDRFWVEVSRHAINDILRQLGREDIPMPKLLGALGVDGEISDIDGLLCKGTYEQIGLAIGGVLREYGTDIPETDIVKMTLLAYDKNADAGKVEPVCDNIRAVLEKLKNEKYDIIFLDPPYNSQLIKKTVEKVFSQDMLSTDGTLIVETDDEERILKEIEKYKENIYDTRSYGRVKLIFLRKE